MAPDLRFVPLPYSMLSASRSATPGALANRIGKLALSFVGGVLVDQRSAGADMTHSVYQFTEARALIGGQGVPVMSQIVEVDAGHADLGDCGHPCAAVEIAVPKRRAHRAGEYERLIVGRVMSAGMRQLVAARSWLTVYRLPAYAPELNPVGGVWSSLKRSLANLAEQGIDRLTAGQGPAQARLRRMQYWPSLIDGFLAKTGLDLTPSRF
jgi:hypothetical protein